MSWKTTRRAWNATNPITGVTETHVSITLPQLPPADLLPEGKARELRIQIEKLDAERRRLDTEAKELVRSRPDVVKRYEHALAQAVVDETAGPKTNPIEKVDAKIAALREQAEILQNAIDIPLVELGQVVNAAQGEIVNDARTQVADLVDRLRSVFDDDFATDVERLGAVSGFLRWAQAIEPNVVKNFGGSIERDLVAAVATIRTALDNIEATTGARTNA